MKHLQILIALLAFCCHANADEVLLVDGTHLQGKLVLSGDVVQFVADGTSKATKYPISQVRSLRHSPGDTDAIVLIDGTEVLGRALLTDDGMISFEIKSLGLSSIRKIHPAAVALLVMDNRSIDDSVPNPEAPAPGSPKPATLPPADESPPWAVLGEDDIPANRITIEVDEVINCRTDPWRLEKMAGLRYALRNAEEGLELIKARLKRGDTPSDTIERQLASANGLIRLLKTELNRARSESNRGMTILRGWDGTNRRWIQVECRRTAHRRLMRHLDPGDLVIATCEPEPHSFKYEITPEVLGLDFSPPPGSRSGRGEEYWRQRNDDHKQAFEELAEVSIDNTGRSSAQSNADDRWDLSTSLVRYDSTEPIRCWINFGQAYTSCELVSLERTSAASGGWSGPDGTVKPWLEGPPPEDAPVELKLVAMTTASGRSYFMFKRQQDSLACQFTVDVYAKKEDGSRGRKFLSDYTVEPALGQWCEVETDRPRAPRRRSSTTGYELVVKSVTWCPGSTPESP